MYLKPVLILMDSRGQFFWFSEKFGCVEVCGRTSLSFLHLLYVLDHDTYNLLATLMKVTEKLMGLKED